MTSDAHARFDEALDALDFEGARDAMTHATDDARLDMQTRYEAVHSDTKERAAQLAGRIQSMARADHYEGLLALAEDDSTDPLLDLLSSEIKRGAILHLDGARRRRERFRSAAVKHMDAARDALVLLDTTKARAELDRVDRRWLDETQRSALSVLEQQTEDAAEERRDLDARTAEVLRDHHPSQTSSGARRKMTSVRAGRGCGSSVIVMVAVVGAVTAILL